MLVDLKYLYKREAMKELSLNIHLFKYILSHI